MHVPGFIRLHGNITKYTAGSGKLNDLMAKHCLQSTNDREAENLVRLMEKRISWRVWKLMDISRKYVHVHVHVIVDRLDTTSAHAQLEVKKTLPVKHSHYSKGFQSSHLHLNYVIQVSQAVQVTSLASCSF